MNKLQKTEALQEKAWRNDAVAKVTGRARYTDDLKFHNLLHAAPVYTDHVHARLVRVNTDEAEAVDGVVRVITAADVPGSCRYGQILRDHRILADDKIRYNGDVVAVVVGETREAAVQGSTRVTVEAVPLPALLDPESAMVADAPLVHDENGSNIVHHHKIRRGDVERGLAESDVVLEEEFQTQFVEHAYMEPESAVCVPRPDGVIEVYGSMQHPFSTRRFVASFLGVDLGDVDVKTVPMGGGFGGKDDTAAVVCARAALAARLTGRPVKLTYDRSWSIRESYKRHPYQMRYTMGVGKDGRIRAMKIRIVADSGAYCSTTPFATWRSTVQCCGPYVVENVWCDTFGVYTNNVFTGAMRGFGAPQINFAVEQMTEMAAERVGLSGVEFRRRNMVRQGSETITGQKLDNHVVSLEESLDAVLDEAGYEELLGRCNLGKGDGDDLYGVGLAISYRGMSLGAEGMDFNPAILNVQFDGSILVEVGIHDNGQGAESAMVLLVADELGVSRDRIRYRQPSTSNIPDGGTTVASRGTLVGGGAVADAARKLRARIAQHVAPELGCGPEAVTFHDDRIWGDGDTSLGFEEAMQVLYRAREFPNALGTFKAPDVSWDEETGQGDAYFTWVYGCQAVELSVSRRTGKVTLHRAWAAHDVGRAVNRPMVLGQIYGGMAMGIGYALHEDVESVDGCIRSLNLNRYRIPRPVDMPEMKAIILENPDPQSPTGAKGVGEPTIELMAPAIANAVYHATGTRYHELPIRVEKKR